MWSAHGMPRCLLAGSLVIVLAVASVGAAGDRGFVQVAPSWRYFQFEDGTPFFVVGQNDWPPVFDIRKQPRQKLERYFRNLSEHGVNVLRLLVEAAKPEQNIYVETRPGVFNPAFKRWMDSMVALAEKHDVYLIVVLYPNLIGGPFGNWRLHPYSTARPGGVIEHNYEMITSPVARELEKRRFRYFVDNWGHSTHIFSWELFNEFWYPDKNLAKRQQIEAHNAWIDEMGAYIKKYELKKLGRYHLRSVSTMRSEFPGKRTGLNPEDSHIFDSDQLDFASFHGYGQTLREAMNTRTDLGILMGKRIEPERLVTAVRHTMDRMLRRAPGRPILCTEDFQIANPHARAHKNPANPLRKMLRGYSDQERYDLFHVANWAYLMSGAAGTTMRYPSGFFEDALYDRMLVISKFAARVPWHRFAARPAHDQVSTDRADLMALAQSDGAIMIAWLYHKVKLADRTRIEPRVTFRGLDSGKYEIRWIDTSTAATLRTERARGPRFTLKAPPFQGHIACIIRRL